MKNIKQHPYFYLLLVFFSISSFSQEKEKYPTKYFQKPLQIPLVLSGTFGELRSNHFHSGIDIKTQGKEGLKVYATANGYVSRIKIAHWGYGKALYITHPNGYTTVYAHLQKFNSAIEKYVKKQQYKKESFEIQLFPKNKELLVKKGEVIAYSGNTGGSFGPHLHYEIRDEKEDIINPLLFGINIEDDKRPQINALIVYPLHEKAQVNQSNQALQIPFKQMKNGNLLTDKVVAYGKIGFGINTFDRLGKAYNKNGIYKLSVKVNGQKTHKFTARKFSFSETKYINLLIDYERFKTKKQRVQKCFIEPLNKLSLYTPSYGDGSIQIKDNEDYKVEIEVADIKGNTRKIIIPIQGKKQPILIQRNEVKTPYYIEYNQFYKFHKKGVTVAFPKYTFYQNLYLDFTVSDSVVHVHTPTLPLHKKYTLTFDTSPYSENQKKQLYINKINEKGQKSYIKTVKKKNKCYTTTKYLGDYALAYDSIPPQIKLYKSRDKQWMTKYTTLRVKIEDNESGIKSYRAEVDGKWILMEYNAKKGILTYDFKDKKFKKAKHTLMVTVVDNVGNTKKITNIFYRKK